MPRTTSNSRDAVDAIRFQQGIGTGEGQIMYLCALPSAWLMRNAQIDRWHPDLSDDDYERQGYQRELSESHIRAIVRYLRGSFRNGAARGALPVFPTSVLLACRKPLEFSPVSEQNQPGPHWCTQGRLTIPEGVQLYIIDGQHRIEGIRKAIEEADPETQALLEDYHLPVTVMECGEKVHELYHFVTINKEAKSVRTDLAEQLLDVVRAQQPDLIRDESVRRATQERSMPLAIVRRLGAQEGQPWFGRIAKPNERRKGSKTASQGQLSKSLRHICRSKPLGWDLDRLTAYVVDFWRVLAELLPDVFKEPRGHTIQRAVGFGALHQVLPNLATCYDGTPKSLRRILEGVDPYFTESGYWAKGGESSQYSSEGGYRIHAERIFTAISEQSNQ